MNPEIEKIIKEQAKILPREVINIIADPAFGIKISTIGKKNGLTDEEIGTFQLETNLVLLGLVHPDEYENEVKNRLKINDIKAENIVSDINREILSEVRGKLTAIFTTNDESYIDHEGRRVTEPKWMQNLDFILSGGDYYFLTEEPNNASEVQKTDKLLGTSNILETKNRLLE